MGLFDFMTSSLKSKLGMSTFGTLVIKNARKRIGNEKASYYQYTAFLSLNFPPRNVKTTMMKGMRKLALKTLRLLLLAQDSLSLT